MTNQPPSPCIAVCKLETDNSGTQLCVGCLRSLDEIVQWSRMTIEQKQQVLDRIEQASAKAAIE